MSEQPTLREELSSMRADLMAEIRGVRGALEGYVLAHGNEHQSDRKADADQIRDVATHAAQIRALEDDHEDNERSIEKVDNRVQALDGRVGGLEKTITKWGAIAAAVLLAAQILVPIILKMLHIV